MNGIWVHLPHQQQLVFVHAFAYEHALIELVDGSHELVFGISVKNVYDKTIVLFQQRCMGMDLEGIYARIQENLDRVNDEICHLIQEKVSVIKLELDDKTGLEAYGSKNLIPYIRVKKK